MDSNKINKNWNSNYTSKIKKNKVKFILKIIKQRKKYLGYKVAYNKSYRNFNYYANILPDLKRKGGSLKRVSFV